MPIQTFCSSRGKQYIDIGGWEDTRVFNGTRYVYCLVNHTEQLLLGIAYERKNLRTCSYPYDPTDIPKMHERYKYFYTKNGTKKRKNQLASANKKKNVSIDEQMTYLPRQY